MSFCHIERQATRVPCTPFCLGAWPNWLIILTTTLTRVPVWVNLGLQRGSQPEGMRLDEFPKGWLYNRQIPLEGHVPMASWSKWGAPLQVVVERFQGSMTSEDGGQPMEGS